MRHKRTGETRRSCRRMERGGERGCARADTIRRVFTFQVSRLHEGHLSEHRLQGVSRLPRVARG